MRYAFATANMLFTFSLQKQEEKIENISAQTWMVSKKQ